MQLNDLKATSDFKNCNKKRMHARRKEEGREKEETSSSKGRSKVEIQHGEANSLSLIGWKDEQDGLGGVGVDGGTKEDWVVEKQKF